MEKMEKPMSNSPFMGGGGGGGGGVPLSILSLSFFTFFCEGQCFGDKMDKMDKNGGTKWTKGTKGTKILDKWDKKLDKLKCRECILYSTRHQQFRFSCQCFAVLRINWNHWRDWNKQNSSPQCNISCLAFWVLFAKQVKLNRQMWISEQAYQTRPSCIEQWVH